MANVHNINRFKLYRAVGLKEWGYFDEAFALLTEVILSEVDGLNVEEIKKAKKDSQYVDAEHDWDEYHTSKWWWSPSGTTPRDTSKRHRTGFS